MTPKTKRKEAFRYRKIYSNGDITYSDYFGLERTDKAISWSEELEQFEQRKIDYKESSNDPESKYSYQELIELDFTYQKMQNKLNPDIESKKNSVERSNRRRRSKIRDYTLENDFKWAMTLTRKNQIYDRKKMAKTISKFFDNLKQRHHKDLKVLFVLEQHNKGGWHAHALVNDAIDSSMYNSGHKDKQGREIYKLSKYEHNGFSDSTLIDDTEKITNYLIKYTSKDIKTNSHEQGYFVSQGLNLPISEEGHFIIEVVDEDKYYSEPDFHVYKKVRKQL